MGDELAAASLPFSGSKTRDLHHQGNVAASNNLFCSQEAVSSNNEVLASTRE